MLFLSCHLPWPAISGGRRRELELIKRVAEDVDVHLLVVSKTPAEDSANAAALVPTCRAVEVFAAETGPPDQPHAIRRHGSARAGARVRELLASGAVDLVHVEGFYLMQHVPPDPGVPVLLVEQNVEYELERQRAEASEPGVTRLRTFAEWTRTQRAELGSWARASLLGAVTSEDCELIAAAATGTKVRLLPDGADHVPDLAALPRTRSLPRPPEPLIVFLANFAYTPNVDAAHNLCVQIVPQVRSVVPHARTWLVGNAPPAEVRELANVAVAVTGYVPDVVPYLDAADVVVCPLRIGGGIKVKAIEALRRGKATVSTSVGAQGLSAEARAALVVRDRAEEFASATATLLRDARARAERERLAAAAGRGLPSWDEAARGLSSVYEELLSGDRGERTRPVAAGGVM